MSTPAKESFLRNVEQHLLTIENDDGINRCLLLKAPDTGNQHFRITTWKDHLCISGDMGTFVFSRIADMFEFFRNDSHHWGINPCYWAEKVEGQSVYGGGIREYNHDAVKRELAKRRDQHVADLLDGVGLIGMVQEKIDAAKEAVADFLEWCEPCEWDAVSRINNWDADDAGGMDLDNFWCDTTTTQFTYHYLWCCHAIVWAIRQYDAAKNKQEAV